MADEELVFRLRAEHDRLKKDYQKAVNHTKKMNSNMSSIGKKMAGTFAGMFAVGGIVAFGKSVIETTANFQKMEAVLTNTLGSGSAAKGAMDMIVDFASKTPFAVDALTGAFVKLANQGFVPTQEEMRKLGDLAASTGKDFDQLAEAVIDAQVGEFERLKEFGIRASKQGDKVMFTFKGVQKQVDFTSESIQDYVLSLGDAEGVSGSMAAISETVGGKISNMGDNFTQLAATIGDSTSGLIASILDLTNNALSQLNGMLKTSNTLTESGASAWDKIKIAFQVYTGQYAKATKRIYDLTKQKAAIDALVKEMDKRKAAAKAMQEQTRALIALKEAEAKPSAMLQGQGFGGPQMAESQVPSMIADPAEMFEAQWEAIQGPYAEFIARMQTLNDGMNATLQQTIASAISTFADSIVTDGLAAALRNVAVIFAEGISNIADQLIAYGVMMAISKKALANPFSSAGAAIAAGVAAKLAAAALKGAITGGSNSMSQRLGGGGGGRAFDSSTRGQSVDVNGEFLVRGKDLALVLNRENGLKGRTG